MTRAQEILRIATKCNQADDMLFNAYAISSDETFDAVVVAPTWTPMRVNGFTNARITDCKALAMEKAKHYPQSSRQPLMKKKSESYILEWQGLRIAWLKTGTCAGNVLDSVLFLSNLHTDRLIFVGAAGGVIPDVALSEVLTPSCVMIILVQPSICRNIWMDSTSVPLYPRETSATFHRSWKLHSIRVST